MLCSKACCIDFDEEKGEFIVNCKTLPSDEVKEWLQGLKLIVLSGAGATGRESKIRYHFSIPLSGALKMHDIEVKADGTIVGKRQLIILSYIGAVLDAILGGAAHA